MGASFTVLGHLASRKRFASSYLINLRCNRSYLHVFIPSLKGQTASCSSHSRYGSCDTNVLQGDHVRLPFPQNVFLLKSYYSLPQHSTSTTTATRRPMDTPRTTSNGGHANPSTPKLLSSKASVSSMQSTMSRRRHSPFPASLRKPSAPTHTAVSHVFAQPKIASGEGVDARAKLQRRVAAEEEKESSSLDSTQLTRGGPTGLTQEPPPSLQPSPLGPTSEPGLQGSATVGGTKQRAASMGWLSLRGTGQSAPNSNYDDASPASISSSSRRQPTMDSMTSSVETIRPSHGTRTPKPRSVTVGNGGGGGAEFDRKFPLMDYLCAAKHRDRTEH